MAVTIRFRPVLFGSPTSPTAVFCLVEQPTGRVVFRDMEVPWPLAVGLEAATPDDLPPFYRRRNLDVVVLPPEEVIGETLAEAHQSMTAALQARYAGAVAVTTGSAQRV